MSLLSTFIASNSNHLLAIHRHAYRRHFYRKLFHPGTHLAWHGSPSLYWECSPYCNHTKMIQLYSNRLNCGHNSIDPTRIHRCLFGNCSFRIISLRKHAYEEFELTCAKLVCVIFAYWLRIISSDVYTIEAIWTRLTTKTWSQIYTFNHPVTWIVKGTLWIFFSLEH